MLHVGFDNYINPNQVFAIVDYHLAGSRRMVKTAREERPRSVLYLNKKRAIETLIIMDGDRYVLSAIPAKQLRNRWTELYETPVDQKAPYTKKDANTRGKKET